MVKNLMLVGVVGMLHIMEHVVNMQQIFLLPVLKLVHKDVFMMLEYHEFMSHQVLNILVIHDMLFHGSKQKEMVKFVGIN